MEDTVTTNVIKRNGEEVNFDRAKIVNAITKANGNVERIPQMNPYQIEAIADTIAEQVQEMPPVGHVPPEWRTQSCTDAEGTFGVAA